MAAAALVAAAALCVPTAGHTTTIFSYSKPTEDGGALLGSYFSKWGLTALSPGGASEVSAHCSAREARQSAVAQPQRAALFDPRQVTPLRASISRRPKSRH
jgi:hypothetical protein